MEKKFGESEIYRVSYKCPNCKTLQPIDCNKGTTVKQTCIDDDKHCIHCKCALVDAKDRD